MPSSCVWTTIRNCKGRRRRALGCSSDSRPALALATSFGRSGSKSYRWRRRKQNSSFISLCLQSVSISFSSQQWNRWQVRVRPVQSLIWWRRSHKCNALHKPGAYNRWRIIDLHPDRRRRFRFSLSLYLRVWSEHHGLSWHRFSRGCRRTVRAILAPVSTASCRSRRKILRR